MGNPLFNNMNSQNYNMQNMQNMMNSFNQFRKTFSGNPQQQVQNLLNSGKVSQELYNQAVQMANNFRKFLGM
jgi:TATA-box binding protein (TBP) (component of TFIID and TFIIIB)